MSGRWGLLSVLSQHLLQGPRRPCWQRVHLPPLSIPTPSLTSPGDQGCNITLPTLQHAKLRRLMTPQGQGL